MTTLVCTLKRKGGSRVTFPANADHGTDRVTEYHFAPNERDDHIAEVDNKFHRRNLLAVPGGAYDIYEPDDENADDVQTGSADGADAGQDTTSGGIGTSEGAGATVSAEPDPSSAGSAAPVTEDPDNSPSEDTTTADEAGEQGEQEDGTEPTNAEDGEDTTSETIPEPETPLALEEMSVEELQARFREISGREPNPQAKEPGLIKAIRALEAEAETQGE